LIFAPPAFVHDRVASAASLGASAARDTVRGAMVLSHEPMRRQFGNLMDPPTFHLLKSDLSVKQAAMRMKWGIGRGEP
jgi:hypothetical protein